jgi:two-component system cell cycle response regulator
MTRVLTVDDSRAIRNIVQKQLTECGFEVDEAEDGEKGLAALEECVYDLVVLDVTMPVLDGPGMLAKMREAGHKTPVLMLTSESKRSVIAGCMKLGIDDYILKPFKPDELRGKVLKALKQEGGASLVTPVAPGAPAGVASVAASEPSAARAPATGEAGPRPFVDVLVVDDMENVQRKLRSLLPANLTLHAAMSAQAALASGRDKVCRVILVDVDIPDVNSVALMNQLRALQPHAAILALPLRSAADMGKDAREQGFDGVLVKPFQSEEIEDFLLKYFDNQDVLTLADNVLQAGPYTGKEDRVDRYYARLVELSRGALEKAAAACFDDAILDLTAAPLKAERTVRAVLDVDRQAKKLGLALRLVGTREVAKVLTGFADTAAMPFYASVPEARQAA